MIAPKTEPHRTSTGGAGEMINHMSREGATINHIPQKENQNTIRIVRVLLKVLPDLPLNPLEGVQIPVDVPDRVNPADLRVDPVRRNRGRTK